MGFQAVVAVSLEDQMWTPATRRRHRRERLFETLNHNLLMRDRERAGRAASPSAAVIDSQSVKTTGAGRLAQSCVSSRTPRRFR